MFIQRLLLCCCLVMLGASVCCGVEQKGGQNPYVEQIKKNVQCLSQLLLAGRDSDVEKLCKVCVNQSLDFDSTEHTILRKILDASDYSVLDLVLLKTNSGLNGLKNFFLMPCLPKHTFFVSNRYETLSSCLLVKLRKRYPCTNFLMNMPAVSLSLFASLTGMIGLGYLLLLSHSVSPLSLKILMGVGLLGMAATAKLAVRYPYPYLLIRIINEQICDAPYRWCTIPQMIDLQHSNKKDLPYGQSVALLV